MTFHPDRPFNDLPSLPPVRDIETKPVLKACIEARAALAELRVFGRIIPGKAVLINSIPLLEAQASSGIENIFSAAGRLFRFANDTGGRAGPAAREALRYPAALNRGLGMLHQRPLSTAIRAKKAGAPAAGNTSAARQTADAVIAGAAAEELECQQTQIELTASGNIVPADVTAAQGPAPASKHAEGYPGKRLFVTSGVRPGGSVGASRGFREAEFEKAGALILRVIDALPENPEGNQQAGAEIRAEVRARCAAFPVYGP